MAAFASWQQTRQLPTAQLSPPPRKQHLFPHQGDDMFNMLLVRDELSNENPHRDMITALSLAARLPQPQGGSWLFPDRLNHLRASWIQSVLTEWGVGSQTSTKSPQMPRGCRAWSETGGDHPASVPRWVPGCAKALHEHPAHLRSSGKVPLPNFLVLFGPLVSLSMQHL